MARCGALRWRARLNEACCRLLTMTLSPTLRNRLCSAIAAGLAVFIGVKIANGSFAMPVIVITLVTAIVVSWFHVVPVSTMLLGAAMVGYIVGNRGFAQLSITNNLPLLPAELVLLIAGSILIFRSAIRQELPLRAEALNVAILLWMALSTVRLYADIQIYGAMALRDYATVYYASFFFLAQAITRESASLQFLRRAVIVGCVVLVAIYPLFIQFPDLFLSTLTVRGTPLIFFKGDLAGAFMVVGALMLFGVAEERKRRWAIPLAILLMGSALATNNRASMLALFIATLLLATAGWWRPLILQTAVGTFAVLVLLFAAHVTDKPWMETPLGGMYERVASLLDPLGKRNYSATGALDKGDNNLFRAVWWQSVYEETMSGKPLLGLGYGRDLAERFVREYYPEGDTFSTRSPHNVLLTIFARTGAVGLVPFLVIIALVIRRTIQCARRNRTAGTLWASTIAVFVTACFGVVLEGPMGAVVFWSLLGMANSAYANLATAERELSPTPPLAVCLRESADAKQSPSAS